MNQLGAALTLQDLPVPAPRPGTVLLRIEASPLLSYLKAYMQGELPTYTAPMHPFTPGTNAVGTIETMYPAGAYRHLIGLLQSGLLDTSPIQPRVFPLTALSDAMEASARAGHLECVVVQP